MEDFEFRKLNLENLRTLMEWARLEGWNPGPNDAEVYWATDPDGFYGYFDNGHLIAGGSVVSYNGEFGFMGLFIVKPEFRGKGIGKVLWYQRRDLLLSRLNKGAAIGMDGVESMQPFYNKGGFEFYHNGKRFENIGERFEVDVHISSIHEEDFLDVLTLDKKCFGFLRPQFLAHWFKMPNIQTFKYKKNDKLLGFAAVRQVDQGYKVGPLFSENSGIAKVLYKACLNSVVGEPLRIDVPEVNTQAIEMIHTFGGKFISECGRMYYGYPPKVDIDKVFGITTFELG